MIIGIPKEVKNREYRVGATPSAVRAFSEAGHQVWVEKGAGAAIGFTDEIYTLAGAKIKETVWDAEMILKVKEPQSQEVALLHEGQILFCYLHLAPEPILTKELLEKKVVGIAFETVTDALGRLPLLIPSSEIAGRLSIQVGGALLTLPQGKKGILLGGVAGVERAKVVILGGGISGTEAARMALGAGAEVIVLDRDLHRLRHLEHLFGPRLQTLFSSVANLEALLPTADLVIGAVLIPGKLAPRLITRAMLQKMEKGSVIVDLSIDQGGCTEMSRPTTHDDPTFEVDGIIHYCVTNMPGSAARTATEALANATASYALKIADLGWKKAIAESPGLREGLNVCFGKVTHRQVAEDLGYEYDPSSC